MHIQPEMDADAAQAVEDVLEVVAELGQVAGRAIRSGPNAAGHADEEYCRELFERVASRARHAGIEPATLLNLAGDRIAATTRSRRIDIAPLLDMRIAA